MALQRDRTSLLPRLFTNSKYHLLAILTFGGFIFLHTVYTNRTVDDDVHNDPTDLLSPERPSDLLDKEKVLVPVHIGKLFDYHVVCGGAAGALNRQGLIHNLSQTCDAKLSPNVSVELHPPKTFDVRTLSTAQYATQWQPSKTCSILRNETVAIMIPYRDREENLQRLLYNLVPTLQRQSVVNYKIFVVEQQAPGPFNKGRLNNMGFQHVMNTYKPSCVIFHDVDLILENEHSVYTCMSPTNHPIHMSANVRYQTDGGYTTIYDFLVGGVLALRPQSYVTLNGYSNRYFNWGGEDDDIGLRMLAKDICVQRPTSGYFFAAGHASQTRNNKRVRLLFDAVLRQNVDGLSNIGELAAVADVHEYPLVTWLKIDWRNQSLPVS